MPPIDLPEPVQIMGKAGDITIAHYQVAHTAMCNASDSIRYACFFRICKEDHDLHVRDCMTDIWKEWDGIRNTAGILPTP